MRMTARDRLADERKESRARRLVPALEYARCPRGHASVYIGAGRDEKGLFLEALCREPGCGAREVIDLPAARAS